MYLKCYSQYQNKINITLFQYKSKIEYQKVLDLEIYCMIKPAVMDCLLKVRPVRIVSKNTRRVFSIPEKISGTRNLSMIMARPNPKTLSMFIHLIFERSLNSLWTKQTTLANYQTAPPFAFDQIDQEGRNEVPVLLMSYIYTINY